MSPILAISIDLQAAVNQESTITVLAGLRWVLEYFTFIKNIINCLIIISCEFIDLIKSSISL